MKPKLLDVDALEEEQKIRRASTHRRLSLMDVHPDFPLKLKRAKVQEKVAGAAPANARGRRKTREEL